MLIDAIIYGGMHGSTKKIFSEITDLENHSICDNRHRRLYIQWRYQRVSDCGYWCKQCEDISVLHARKNMEQIGFWQNKGTGISNLITGGVK